MPKPRAKRPRARVVMLAIVLALGIGLAGHAMRPGTNTLPSGTSAFVNGKGVGYRASDGSYTVQFPKAPSESRDADELGQYAVTINSVSVTTDDYELATASIALPDAPTGALATQLLADALAAGVSRVGGTGSQSTPRTRGTLPALEASFKAPDGFSARALVMIDGKWLFELLVHARTGTDRLFGALDAWFVPLPA